MGWHWMPRSIITLLLITSVQIAGATCHVITPGGSNSTGPDWNNPAGLGVSYIAGDTYYLAGGSGGSYTSSTTTIPLTITSGNVTVKAATVADHCTDTGWNAASMAVDGGAGQAILTTTGGNGLIWIRASGVTIDGNAGIASDTSSSWANPLHACGGNQCGIKLDNSMLNSYEQAHSFIWNITIATGVNNTTIKSLEIVGCGPSCGSLGITTDMLHTEISGTHQSGITVTHNYWHDSSQGFVATYGTSGTVVTYNYFLRNYSHSVAPAVHGYTWSVQGGSDLTFAFNAVQDTQGTSVIDEVNAGCCNTTSNLTFFGNVVWTSNGNPAGSTGYGNAVVSCTNGDICSNWLVYNNTIVNMAVSGGLNYSLSFGNGTPGAGSSITEANNLFWNSTPASNGNSCGGNSSCTTDYDYFNSTTHTGQTHQQVTSGNPFTNWGANNFRPTADTNPGTTLPAPFNVDPDGNPRTTWTRGAFQYAGGGSANVVAPPTLLTATVQ